MRGLLIPTSMPSTRLAAARRSSRVTGASRSMSVRHSETTTRCTPSPSGTAVNMPVGMRRMPTGTASGSVSVTSPRRDTEVASVPEKPMPACLRTRLRAPSQPTAYRAASR